MNFYVMLALLVVGGIGMSFLVSTAYYYENQSRDQFMQKYCPTREESCLNTLFIEPTLSMPATIGWVVYMMIVIKKILDYKFPERKKVNE